jgi:hypothetical protein
MGKETPELLAAIRARLSYDPKTGKILRGNRPAFTAVNKNSPRGYLVGKVGDVQMYAHRVAWALQTGAWPAGQIDHINGDSLDNRWANLRVVTAEQNQKNRRLNRNNRSGVSGVMYLAELRVWQAQIKHRGRMRFLGHHACFFKAVKARKAAEIELGFHQNHGRARVHFDA